MVETHDPDTPKEDDYDEEEDSDFEGGGADEEIISSSSDEEESAETATGRRPTKRRKVVKPKPKKAEEDEVELDSGDEATIKERQKDLKRLKKKGEDLEDDLDEDQSWRAKTRAMRERDKDEKKKNKLASVKGSTIDVDKIWAEMNRPGASLPPPAVVQSSDSEKKSQEASPRKTQSSSLEVSNENAEEEMIIIKIKYKFAGEVHTEEKSVPKSSRQAQQWLSQQSFDAQTSLAQGTTMRRPLRKISRFDPNFNNLQAFKTNWARDRTGQEGFKGPKLNTVMKSKMDWDAHVDTEGLHEELQEYAKAKDGYLSRTDFLHQVEKKKDEQARLARLKG